jgi:hypothetical protein
MPLTKWQISIQISDVVVKFCLFGIKRITMDQAAGGALSEK